MKNIVLDIELVTGNETALIIKYPTGVEYEVQCGGLACNHPTCEGFVLNLGNFASAFNDCEYGCENIPYLPDSQRLLANDLNRLLTEKTKSWAYSIEFDFDRISELQEGWWPVRIKGKINGGIIPTKKVDLSGYIHIGNCD